ncbi:extracellular solute-binding protein [Patescibacteria group bacterium]|nr:extracellular solute-binding protein [Patescibacteria group bacterium]
MSNFKIAILTIFGISSVVGIAVFALSKATVSPQSANLVVWGTISNEAFDSAYQNSTLKSNKEVKIAYVKKDTANFDSEFVEALAEGTGPDIVILRDDFIYKNSKKLFVIPYKSYPARTFKDKFIEEGEIFLSTDGIVAVPFIIDPMVLYWNRDMFSNNQISQPPQYWDQIYPLVDKITNKDSSGNILKSAIALGEWRNITNAKEIISMLLLQAGTPITSRTSQGVMAVLNSQFDYPIAPGTSAINFYTQFSNPTSATYTWNRALPSSLNFFLSGNLSMYLGFASEIFPIQQKNSNLNFDVTYVPQIRDSAKKSVFGHMYSLAIVKQSKQIGGSFLAVNALTEATALTALETITNLPPVRRDLLSNKPADAFRSVFYSSALIAHSWIDPDAYKSAGTLRDMIESITSGRNRVSEALNTANDELGTELK